MIASGFEAEIPLADNLQVYAPTCHPAADTTSHGAEGLTYQRMCSLATILSSSVFMFKALAEYIYT